MKQISGAITGLMLLAGCGHAPATQTPDVFERSATSGVESLAFNHGLPGGTDNGPLHFYFCADTHDGYALFNQLIGQANSAKPAFVLNGGDLTEQGTPQEFKLLNSTLLQLQVPFIAVPGNHDYKNNNIARFTQKFGEAPKTFDASGVHFAMIDDANQSISEANFKFLESDLAANQGKPIVVAMHVPVQWQNTPAGIQMLHDLMPGTIAEPKVENTTQVARFESMMSQYHVSLVLAGHTHLHGDYVVQGVPYVVVGAAGGKLMNVGASHEYLDVTIDQGKVDFQHVALDKPTTSIIEVATNMLDYYLEQRKEIADGIEVGN